MTIKITCTYSAIFKFLFIQNHICIAKSRKCVFFFSSCVMITIFLKVIIFKNIYIYFKKNYYKPKIISCYVMK